MQVSIEQMTWMFFLKGYDTQEETWEYKAYKEKKEYNSIIPESLRRRVSALSGQPRHDTWALPFSFPSFRQVMNLT